MSYEAWGSPPDNEPERCPLCDGTEHIAGCEVGELERRHRQRLDAAVDKERKACADSIRQLSALLRRADIQIMKWAETYGANNPQWLPPAGDVPLLEDIAEAIRKANSDIARLASESRVTASMLNEPLDAPIRANGGA